MNKLSRVISPGAVILVVGILLVSLPAGLKAQGEAWSPVDRGVYPVPMNILPS